jgi:hypothetical protein
LRDLKAAWLRAFVLARARVLGLANLACRLAVRGFVS